MNLPLNKLNSLVQGIYDGDGNKREDEIVQTSKILALQLVEILNKLDKQPFLSLCDNSHVLTINGNRRRVAYRVTWQSKVFEKNKGKIYC